MHVEIHQPSSAIEVTWTGNSSLGIHPHHTIVSTQNSQHVLALSVVGSGGSNSITSHADTLDSDSSTSVAGSPDPSSGGTNAARNLKEVVGLPGGAQPGFSTVDADLEFCGPALAVDDLGREPVLRDAALHVDLERRGDWACDVVPGQVDDAYALGGERGKGGWEEVKVVCAAAGTFIDNHCGDGLAIVGGADAATAVAAVVPVGAGECGAVEVGGEGICAEGACTTGYVAAIESGLA